MSMIVVFWRIVPTIFWAPSTVNWTASDEPRTALMAVRVLKATAETGESANVRVDRGATQVLEQIVMDMNAVRTRLAGQSFIEIGQVSVDKVGKWLRWVHFVKGALCFCVP